MLGAYNNNTILSGYRLKLIREWRNKSQAELAEFLECSVEEIQKAEEDLFQCNFEQLGRVKKFFDIEDIPLSDEEVRVFKESLYYWRDLIRNRKIDEATDFQEKVSSIVQLPPCMDLVMLYRQFEVSDCLLENHLEAAEEKLRELEKHLPSMDAENQYYFYRNSGSLKSVLRYPSEALKDFLKALTFGEARENAPIFNGALYYNIASCYFDLHLPHQTIAFLEQALDAHGDDRTKAYRLHFDILLAVSYIRIGRVQAAKALLSKCLARAEGALNGQNGLIIGQILHNFGFAHRFLGEWAEAIDYLNKAATRLSEGSEHYLETMYQIVWCTAKMGRYPQALNALERIKELSRYAENQKYILLSETLRCFIGLCQAPATAEAKENADYITTNVLPRLEEAYEYTKMLALCEELGNYYEKFGEPSKALDVIKTSHSIIKRMLYQGGDEK
ncbi:MAG: tetratricopeptide repeat protein [Nitrososphaerota archaeon]|nr:tetratricopeptide repeat protein [Nitrososphaerota archaeon]